MGGEQLLLHDDWIEFEGKKIRLKKGMRVSHLMRGLRVSPLTHIAIVNGRPVPEDYPLEPKDSVEFLMFTVHKEMGGVQREKTL